ncbi:MAG: glycosyltransferase family 39 protein [Nitrospinae bacterium]|nr:glycosyltransferase family 39 protein [Nitrospinota bacterium]
MTGAGGERKLAWYCALLVAGFALFRLVMMGLTGLGDSESYYWAWAHHPALSYYDHPPMVAWLIHLSTSIGGDSVFFTRLPSVFLFIFIGWVFYRLSMRLFNDGRVAFISILTFNLIPMFGIGALQMVPDIPSAACYLLFILIIHDLLAKNGPGWMWLALGVVMGVGLLGKYFAILLLPSAMLLVAMVPGYRHWYKRPEPYLMGVVALLVFSPVIIWNYTNEWPSFKFHLVERHHGPSFSWDNVGRLIGGQMLYVTPLYLIALLWSAYAGFKKALAGDNRYALLSAFSVPTLVFFYVVTAWTNEAEPHWPAFGYLPAAIMMASLGVEAWDRRDGKTGKRLAAYFGVATAMAGMVFALFYIHVFHPILPIKPKYDIVNELIGWDKAGPEIEKAFEKLSVGGQKPFALAHHWVLCSQLMFATHDKIPVACINEKTDQFDFWDRESELRGRPAVIVTDLRFEETPDKLYLFDSVEKLAEIPVMRGGEETRRFTIWAGKNFKGSSASVPPVIKIE